MPMRALTDLVLPQSRPGISRRNARELSRQGGDVDLSTNWKDKGGVVGSLTETSQKVLHVGVVQTCSWPALANSKELHGKS